jgi:hypothetical protein
MRNAYTVCKLEGRSHGTHNGRWEGNIKMDPKIMVREDVNLIHLAQNRVHLWDFVNTVMNRRVP